MDKKKIIGFVLLFIVALGLFLVYFAFRKEEPSNTKVFVNAPLTMEVYEKVKLSEVVQIEEGSLVQDDVLDSLTLGEQQASFTYKDDHGRIHKASFSYMVQDTTEPLIGIGKTYSVLKGSTTKLEDAIMCADNYDKEPLCKIEGSYDLNKVGKYSLVYYAEDSNGNMAEEPFTLNVVEKFNSSSKEKVKISEIKKNYVKENIELGIDVSKWQGVIDFEKVKKEGVSFVFIRLGNQVGPHQDSIIDPYFEQNIKKAKEAGLKVGVYYYSYAGSMEDAITQSSWVMEQLKNYTLDLPVVFDWECYNRFNSFKISLYDLNTISSTFLNEVEKKGYQGMLYGSKNYLEKVWKYQEYPVWLAHYTDETTYTKPFVFWQLTNTGRVDGIEGDVDIDLYYKEETLAN